MFEYARATCSTAATCGVQRLLVDAASGSAGNSRRSEAGSSGESSPRANCLLAVSGRDQGRHVSRLRLLMIIGSGWAEITPWCQTGRSPSGNTDAVIVCFLVSRVVVDQWTPLVGRG